MVIRVVVVDDHAVVRQGLASLLATAGDIDVVATAADGVTALEAARHHLPDVVLMDLQMPQMDGVQATRLITADCPGTDVLVLTSFSDTERILAALDAGAVGYLLKDAEPHEVLDGVRAVARGESPLHPRAARQLLQARSARPAAELSPREREVLRLVMEGLANKQIARRLDITERTVKAHLTAIFQRIGVSDRTQAALWAQQRGL
jgi:DNA-binding NarL/FixJ family response regulator